MNKTWFLAYLFLFSIAVVNGSNGNYFIIISSKTRRLVQSSYKFKFNLHKDFQSFLLLSKCLHTISQTVLVISIDIKTHISYKKAYHSVCFSLSMVYYDNKNDISVSHLPHKPENTVLFLCSQEIFLTPSNRAVLHSSSWLGQLHNFVYQNWFFLTKISFWLNNTS